MNGRVRNCLLPALILLCTGAHAQVAGTGTPKKKVNVFKPTVYFGQSGIASGTISKSQFESLIKSGLTSKDSSGKKYKVVGFDFTYAERNLYEDSVGNLMITADYMNEHCNGDTLSPSLTENLADRIKAGDTAFIDHIMVVRYKNKSNEPMPDSTAFLAKSMKLIISR